MTILLITLSIVAYLIITILTVLMLTQDTSDWIYQTRFELLMFLVWPLLLILLLIAVFFLTFLPAICSAIRYKPTNTWKQLFVGLWNVIVYNDTQGKEHANKEKEFNKKLQKLNN